MMSIESLEQELEEIELKMQPLRSLRAMRKNQLDTEKSKLFINDNDITQDMVQACDGDDIPYFAHITAFAEWMVTNSNKPWCCWNGRIYKTQEIIAGRMDYRAPGMYDGLTD